jgi:hypothetical protein
MGNSQSLGVEERGGAVEHDRPASTRSRPAAKRTAEGEVMSSEKPPIMTRQLLQHRLMSLLETQYAKSTMSDKLFAEHATKLFKTTVSRSQVTQARIVLGIKNNAGEPDVTQADFTEICGMLFEAVDTDAPNHVEWQQRAKELLKKVGYAP